MSTSTVNVLQRFQLDRVLNEGRSSQSVATQFSLIDLFTTRRSYHARPYAVGDPARKGNRRIRACDSAHREDGAVRRLRKGPARSDPVDVFDRGDRHREINWAKATRYGC